MKFSKPGQEKCDCFIEVTPCAGFDCEYMSTKDENINLVRIHLFILVFFKFTFYSKKV
jgi:hypothetical protein